MSSKSRRGSGRLHRSQTEPQPSEEEIQQIKAQADEAVRLLSLVRAQFPRMISEIPRGKMVEYLRHGSRKTYTRYFKGFRSDRIPRARLVGYLSEEVFQNNNGVLAHLIVVLWNDVKRELHEETRKGLQVLNPNVELIERVPADLSRSLLTRLIDKYGREDVAVLSLINDARFDREVVREMLPEWEWPQLRTKLSESDREKLAELQEAGELPKPPSTDEEVEEPSKDEEVEEPSKDEEVEEPSKDEEVEEPSKEKDTGQDEEEGHAQPGARTEGVP